MLGTEARSCEWAVSAYNSPAFSPVPRAWYNHLVSLAMVVKQPVGIVPHPLTRAVSIQRGTLIKHLTEVLPISRERQWQYTRARGRNYELKRYAQN